MEKIKSNKILVILLLVVVFISLFSLGKQFGQYVYQKFN